MDHCYRCPGTLFTDALGDIFCLACGWRRVVGWQLSVKEAAAELRPFDDGRGRKRMPSHAGLRLEMRQTPGAWAR